jgi:DNA-binding MarR family transcriptional regulator
MEPLRSVEDDADVSRLASDLKQSVMRLARELRAERADELVTNSQFAALTEIISAGSLSLRELSERERVSSPAMNRHVTALRDAGYIEGARDDRDRRVVHFRATRKGMSLFERTHRKRDEWLRSELEQLSGPERSMLEIAARLMARIGEGRQTTVPPVRQ